ncbi:MAG: folate family ECF transporter S component [Oscillospiraceae bacterium]|nr:folate family ECF transporter S component [Oscillospiraceae bacterium]
MSKTLYKTPFSRAYWRDAAKDAKALRTLVFSALMVAACVALGLIPSIVVGTGGIKISWGFLGRALCALVGGPVNALVFGFVEDTVGYFMNPDGGYNPFYIFTTMLGAFTYALFLYRAEVTVLRVFLAKLFTNIQNVFLQSLGAYLWYSSKGYWVLVGERAIKNAVMLPIQTLMLAALFAALLPILHRMGFLPNQAAKLRLWKKPEWIGQKKAQQSEKAEPWKD